LAAIEQQLSSEESKHRDRLARLNRVRELAQQQGSTEVVAKADKLLAEEQQQYDMKMRRMELGKNRIVEFLERAAMDKDKKKNHAGPGKDVNRSQTPKE
jgi:hypothetical protein